MRYEIGFFIFSRLIYTDKQSTLTRLEVKRLGYPNKRVSVKYSTLSLASGSSYDTVAGIKVYHALDGRDYETAFGELTFLSGEVCTIMVHVAKFWIHFVYTQTSLTKVDTHAKRFNFANF